MSMNRRFQQVALPHMDAAYNLARWLTGDTAQAEDVTQEAFLRAFRSFGRLRGEDPRTWLLAIVRNVFYTQCGPTLPTEASTEFDQALQALPVEYREAIVLRELEDLSYKGMAATLDIPIGTVMSRLAHARLMLDPSRGPQLCVAGSCR